FRTAIIALQKSDKIVHVSEFTELDKPTLLPGERLISKTKFWAKKFNRKPVLYVWFSALLSADYSTDAQFIRFMEWVSHQICGFGAKSASVEQSARSSESLLNYRQMLQSDGRPNPQPTLDSEIETTEHLSNNQRTTKAQFALYKLVHSAGQFE